MDDSSSSFEASPSRVKIGPSELPKAREEAINALKNVASNTLWVIIALLLIVGASLATSSEFLKNYPLLHHVVRDIGIAILVAAIIAGVYETYARIRFELMLMNSFLGAVIADWSRQDIWNALKSQIIEKTVIRENFRLAMRLQPDERLAAGQMLLKMQVSYALRGLRSESMSAKIEHFLDWHFKVPGHDLPCFKSIRVGKENISLESDAFNKSGEFIYRIKVPPKDGGAIPVTSSRQEVIYFPGTHCFVLNEITKGIEICLNAIPDDIKVFITIRPHADLKYRELKLESEDDRIKIDDIVMFPGQIIEILFQPASQAPAQPDTVL